MLCWNWWKWKLGHEVYNQYEQAATIFNGVDFSQDYNYPEWDKIITFAKDICKNIVHHRLIALDICLDKTGEPRLIEFNIIPGSYSIWLFQYTVGPALKDYTDEILEYCQAKTMSTPLYKLK